MSLLVPRLRFLEFEGEWKPAKGFDAFSKGTEKGNCDLPIYSVTMDRGLVPRNTLDRYLSADAAAEKNQKAYKGDLVYNTMRMWQGAVGEANEDCMVSPAYVVLRPKPHIDSTFFHSWFKTHSMLYKLTSFSHGLTSDRLRLYFGDFSEIPIAIPSLAEQRKIAAFLSAVDEKIGALEAQVEGWQTYKRGLMQALFSQALRFKADDGSDFPDWEEKILGQVGKIVGGGTPSTTVSTNWSGGTVDWYTPTEVKKKYATASKRKITEKGLKSSSAKRLPIGTLLLSTRATVGDVSIATRPSTTNQGFQSIITDTRNDNEFWYYWIKANKRKILRRSSGSTFLEIGKSEVGKLPILRPDLLEQCKIADALSAVDAKIDTLSDHLEQIRTFKRGALQKMFV